MEQVLDFADALHLAGAALEVLDDLGPLYLAAEEHDSVLDVDVDLALRRVCGPEDLGLDLAGERDVVGLRLLLLAEVRRLLLQSVSLGAARSRVIFRRRAPLLGSKKYASAAPIAANSTNGLIGYLLTLFPKLVPASLCP